MHQSLTQKVEHSGLPSQFQVPHPKSKQEPPTYPHKKKRFWANYPPREEEASFVRWAGPPACRVLSPPAPRDEWWETPVPQRASHFLEESLVTEEFEGGQTLQAREPAAAAAAMAAIPVPSCRKKRENPSATAPPMSNPFESNAARPKLLTPQSITSSMGQPPCSEKPLEGKMMRV